MKRSANFGGILFFVLSIPMSFTTWSRPRSSAAFEPPARREPKSVAVCCWR